MIKIIRENGSGKTKELLKYANDNKGIIVCANPAYMREKARCYGFEEIPQFIGYGDEIPTTGTLYIDDLDYFLKVNFSNIVGYNLNKED